MGKFTAAEAVGDEVAPRLAIGGDAREDLHEAVVGGAGQCDLAEVHPAVCPQHLLVFLRLFLAHSSAYGSQFTPGAHALILLVPLWFCRLISLTWFSENQFNFFVLIYIFSDEGSVYVCFNGANTEGLGGMKPTSGTIAAKIMGRQGKEGKVDI